jgi:MFS family permease
MCYPSINDGSRRCRCVALSTFATNKVMLLMGGFLMGIPFGAFACLGEAFASEICPMSLRGYLTGYVNICWCIGESGHPQPEGAPRPAAER